MTSFASSLGMAGVDEQPVGPGLEPVRIPQRGQVPPRLEQRPLRRVLGQVRVAQDPARNRMELVTDESDLDRRGLHPALGEVRLRELLATWAVHDLDHVSQIFAGMAGSHDADVGPWKAYLGILLRRDDPAATPA